MKKLVGLGTQQTSGLSEMSATGSSVGLSIPLASNAIRGSRVSMTKSLLLSWVDLLLLLDAGCRRR